MLTDAEFADLTCGLDSYDLSAMMMIREDRADMKALLRRCQDEIEGLRRDPGKVVDSLLMSDMKAALEGRDDGGVRAGSRRLPPDEVRTRQGERGQDALNAKGDDDGHE